MKQGPRADLGQGPQCKVRGQLRAGGGQFTEELAVLEKQLSELGRDLPSDRTSPKNVAWRAFYAMKRRLSGGAADEGQDVTPDELVRTRERMAEMARRAPPSARDTRLAELLGRLGQLAAKMSDPSCARRIAAGVASQPQ